MQVHIETVPTLAVPIQQAPFSIRRFCDPSFFKSVVNPYEIFCPINWKKAAVWLTGASVLTGLVLVEKYAGGLTISANFSNTALMSIVYLMDPLISTATLLLAKYPPAAEEELSDDDSEYFDCATDFDQPAVSGVLIEDLHEESLCLPGMVETISEQTPERIIKALLFEMVNVIASLQVPEVSTPIVMPPVLRFNRRPENKSVAIVIPAHLAADKIITTLESCLYHVAPEQIFVMDNGNQLTPLDNTRELVHALNPNIHYVWGHYPNKTVAQYFGALLADQAGYQFVFTIDDDVHLPTNFKFHTERCVGNVAAQAYAIYAINPPGADSWAEKLLVHWQDIEYKMAAMMKHVQDRLGGVPYPHGAASLWCTKVLLEVIEKHHDTGFHGEDTKLGWALQSLGMRMAFSGDAYLATEVPSTLFGLSPNLYQQRVRSWEMGRQYHFWRFVKQLFCVAPVTRALPEVLWSKLMEFYSVYTNLIDWVRLPLFIIMLRNPEYWIKGGPFLAGPLLPVLAWNYLKLRKSDRLDLQVRLVDVLSYPVFKVIESGLSIAGSFRAFFIHCPNVPYKPTIPEIKRMETENKEVRAELRKQVHKELSEGAPLTYKQILYNGTLLFKRPKPPAGSADDLIIPEQLANPPSRVRVRQAWA